MLEIITDRKNIGYYKEKQDSNLVGHVKMNQIIMWQIYMLIFSNNVAETCFRFGSCGEKAGPLK